MPQFRAAWLLPISEPPIRNGWIRTDRGRITAFGAHRRGDRSPAGEIDLGDVALLPGLVNAHTHLELSWMRGRVAQTDDFPKWIGDVIALQRSAPPGREVDAASRKAVAEARGTGTVLFGDITNTLAAVPALAESDLSAVVFHELIGFKRDRAQVLVDDALGRREALPINTRLHYALAAHAPYSVSPALFQAIRRAAGMEPFSRVSVHLGESRAETQFVKSGTGPWRKLLEELGTWDPSWAAPGCDPVEYLDQMGVLDERTIVVHGVQFDRSQLTKLRDKGASLVTCPRGNVSTGAGVPPIETFYSSGVRVALGTDSLASVPDLNLFAEMAALRRIAPELDSQRIIESATIDGARALGFDADFGTLDPGKVAAMTAVKLPRDARDAQAHLVSGIGLADVAGVMIGA